VEGTKLTQKEKWKKFKVDSRKGELIEKRKK